MKLFLCKSKANLLKKSSGFRLPRLMAAEFNDLSRKSSRKFSMEDLNDFFSKEYIENTNPFEITAINFEKEFVNTEQERLKCRATIKYQNQTHEAEGTGNGTLNALANAIKNAFGIELEVADYLQHGLTQGSHAVAASYIQAVNKQGRSFWGVGIDTDCTLSAIRAFLSAVNRSQR